MKAGRTFALALLASLAAGRPGLTWVGSSFDPAAHPDFTFIDSVRETIPVKNQAAAPEWVRDVNVTRGASWGCFSKAPRQSSFKCLSYAVSTCCDWWLLKQNKILEFPAYRSFTHGATEQGVNPRELECQYYYRAEQLDEPGFFFMPKPVVDTMTHERLPYSMDAYCRIVTRPLPPRSYPDHELGAGFATYDGKADYGMDGEYETLWRAYRYGGDHDAMAAKLRHALEAHGPCYAGVNLSVPVGLSSHVVAIIGYGAVDGKLQFAYRESFGDGTIGTKTGEPPYRLLPANKFSEVYCFPHELRYAFHPCAEGHVLEVRDPAGNLVDLDQLTVTAEAVAFPYRALGTGRYLFPRPEVPVDTAWEATLSFSKRFFGPAKDGKGARGGGDGDAGYRLPLQFLGTMLRDEVRRNQFTELESQLGGQ